MDRLRGRWALALLLLNAAGCAGGGGRRLAAVSPTGPIPAAQLMQRPRAPMPAKSPAPPRGGLFARRARRPRPVMTAVSPTVARYFPGLARSAGPTLALPKAPAPGWLASRAPARPSPLRRALATADDDPTAPMLPVALNVEVRPDGPDPAAPRLASHEVVAPGEPPPLAEAGPAPDPDPVQVSRDDGRTEAAELPSSPAREASDEPGPGPGVADAPEGPPPVIEAPPALAPGPAPARRRPARPVAYVPEVSRPAELPAVLFPRLLLRVGVGIGDDGIALRSRDPGPGPPVVAPWGARAGLARREPGDVPEGG